MNTETVLLIGGLSLVIVVLIYVLKALMPLFRFLFKWALVALLVTIGLGIYGSVIKMDKLKQVSMEQVQELNEELNRESHNEKTEYVL